MKKKASTVAPGVLAAVLCLFLFACGRSASVSDGLEITKQPSDVGVPLGQQAAFSVTTGGGVNLQYQWFYNDVAIQGANGSSYIISSVSEADTGFYRVVISDGAYSLDSSVAKLTVGPRYPASGDLRFQQVDSVDTVNGYTPLYSGNIVGDSSYLQNNAFGNPLSVGPSCSPGSSGLPASIGCTWILNTFYLPTGAPALNVGYVSNPYSDLKTAESTLLTGDKVVTGMDLEAANNVAAFSYIQQGSGAMFTGNLNECTASNAQAMIQAEAANGHVTTAISFDGAQVAYMSFAWSGESGVSYDTKFQQTSFDNAQTAVQELAEAGYVLTAAGGNEQNGVLLVGTKISGDSIPRQVALIPAGQSPSSLATTGYATVLTLVSGTRGFLGWIGER